MNAHNVNNSSPSANGFDSGPDDAQSRKLDDEFADLTDALLAGRETKESDDLHDLALTVRQLKVLIGSEMPSAAFRSRLARRLNTEWEQNQRARRFGVLSVLTSSRFRPFVALAALLVLLIGAAVIFGQQFSTPVTAGFTTGTVTPVFVIVAGLFVVALIGFGLRRRK
jgi:hypothetical protein